MMASNKVTAILALVLYTAIMGVFVQRPEPVEARQPNEPPALAVAQEENDQPKKERVDRFGDPLPPGALARLGTDRFRHGAHVHSIAFAPGGKVLASRGRYPGLCLFEADTGRLLHRLSPRGGDRIAFSPDGKTLFTGESLIDVATGKEVRRFNTRGAITGAGAAFAPDGSMVASAAFDRPAPILLWDAKTGNVLHRLEGHEAEVESLAFSPTDSKLLASGSQDKTVSVWNAATGKQLHRLDGNNQPVLCVAFAPNGKTLASIGEDSLIRVWDTASGKLLHQLQSDAAEVKVIAFSPDGKLLASVGKDASICLWDPVTEKKLRHWRTGFNFIASLAFAPDGKTISSASGCAICQWDVATGKEINPVICHRADVRSLQFAPDGKTLRSVAKDKKVLEWDLASSQVNNRFFRGTLGTSESEYWLSVALSPDGNILAQTSFKSVPMLKEDHIIRLWDTESGKPLHALSGHSRRVWNATFSPNNKQLASGGADGIRLWDVASGKELHRFQHNVETRSLTFSPDGKLLVSSGIDEQLRVWNVASGKELRQWDGYGPIFSPDGKLIAGSRDPGAVCIWAADSGKELMRFNLRSIPLALAISPSGRILAAGGIGERTLDNGYMEYSIIQMWDVYSGQEIRQVNPEQGIVWSLAFSHDGRTLASGGADSTILLWDLTGRANSKPVALTAKQLDALWADLRGDAPKAEQAIWDLALAPKQSLAFLKDRLRPAAPVDEKQMAKLLAELESKNFNIRQEAEQRLIELGEAAEAGLRKNLENNPPLEVQRRVEKILEKRRPEELRQLRAIDSLEQIGTPEAQNVLRTLASASVNPRVRQASEAALGRLGRQ